ncbi:MAG TPA: DUF1192 domain-containing protein [Caulobacteraceae bacterium]|nr:DUF1192 domain-containing protein [Caulobacteraceae bacterium]
MTEEPAEPRRARGQALTDACKEDLELFGREELEARIDLLQAEIDRVRGHLGRKLAGRAAAEALFSKP